MTPILKIRSFSNDQYTLDKVFYANSYRMRAFKEGEIQPVVVDVGAHCGYFSFAALALGAAKVYSVEPFVENIKLLLDNTSDSRLKQCTVIPQGIYVTNTYLQLALPAMQKGNYFDFSYVLPVDSLSSAIGSVAVPVMTLDSLLTKYVTEPVDLLKIHIGYAETQIIELTQSLENVKNICGQTDADLEGQMKLKQLLNSKGFIDVNIIPVEGEDGKVIFQGSRTKLNEMFIK